MIGPRADFACLSKKCATPEGSPSFELPIAATRCPVCGSRRLQRLYNRVQVITKGVSAFTDRVAESAWNEAAQQRETIKAADAAVAAGRVESARVVAGAQAQVQLGALGIGAGKGNLVPHPAHPVQLELKRRPLRPGPASLRDMEYAIRRAADGRAEMAKA